MAARKPQIISFKTDTALADAMRGIPNRSQFIRAAVLAALDSTCPLCLGTGLLTPGQRKHWQDFAASHGVRECHKCHAVHLVCTAAPPDSNCREQS